MNKWEKKTNGFYKVQHSTSNSALEKNCICQFLNIVTLSDDYQTRKLFFVPGSVAVTKFGVFRVFY